MSKFTFDLVTKKGVEKLGIEARKAILIGLSGRDIEKTKAHVKELAEMGIPSPENVPVIYHITPALLTFDKSFPVVGKGSSGEIEFLIIKRGGKIYIGCGSDHTDRDLESVSICKSKFITPKPICSVLWDYDELKDHWDSITLNSWQTVDGVEKLYQSGTAADLLPLERLVEEAEKEMGGSIEDTIVFSGTVPSVDGLYSGDSFTGVIEDKVLDRKLTVSYGLEIFENFI